MKVYKNFNINKSHRNSIILIGNFDGVHLGHRKLFNLAKKFSDKFKIKIGVLTFDPMPKIFFNKKIKNFKISNFEQKKKLLQDIIIYFIIKTKSIDFIEKIIFKKLNPKFIFVSDNFRFGNKREGDVVQLIKYEKKCGYKIIKPEPLKYKNKIASSTLVRSFLEKGHLDKANKLLNRNWAIDGKVEKGRRVGKKIGFPTCNIDIKDYVLAKPGVYAVKVNQKKVKLKLKGIANLGYRPTFNQKKLLLEVHLFNYSANLYNKYLSVEFIKFIRAEKKFKNAKQLQSQIKSDLKIAKKAS